MSTNPYREETHPGGPMSVEEYLQLNQRTFGARYEYLDGVARLMSGGSVGHDRIARNIAHFIDEQFLTGPCTSFGTEVQVLIGLKPNGRKNYVYPDATISCDVADRRLGNKLIRSPRVVFEVLSPSTEALDRSTKLEAYKACPTIQEIVLVSQFARHVEVHRREEEDSNRWTYAQYGPDSAVELTSVDVHLAMDEIYHRVNFDELLLDDEVL